MRLALRRSFQFLYALIEASLYHTADVGDAVIAVIAVVQTVSFNYARSLFQQPPVEVCALNISLTKWTSRTTKIRATKSAN